MNDTSVFYQYVETRASSGYKSAIVYRDPSDTTNNPNQKYSLLVASETVPYVGGSVDTFEFDLLNANSKGKVEGKSTLDDKETECLLHRDNIYRFEQLKGKTLDFMYVTPDLVGYKFTGTIKFRPNDAEADVLRGTYTITPMSLDENPVMDVRPLILETVTITGAVPERITVPTGSTGTDISVECNVADFTITTAYKDNDGTITTFAGTGSVTSGSKKGTITVTTTATSTAYGMLYITVSKSGYAPWTTTVALEAVVAN